MISKIITGKGMRGLAKYLLGDEKNGPRDGAELLGTSFAGETVKDFSREFAAIRRLKPTVNRVVKHVALSFSPEDRRLSDDELLDIASRYRNGMGFPEDAPWILVRHDDTEHFQHVHLVLSRITASGEVVTEAHERHRSRKLTEQLEREFGLVPAVKSNNKEKNMDDNDKQQKQQKRQKAIEAILNEASSKAEIELATEAVASIEPPQSVDAKTRRDYKRDLLDAQYEKLVSNIFAAEVRFVRKHQRGLTLHFNDGSRIEDRGDKITAHGNADAATIAARFVELALAHGWDGITARGSDEVILATYSLALARGLSVSCIDAHQIHLFNLAKQSTGSPPASVTPPVPAPPPPNPVAGLTGLGGFKGRLGDNRNETDSGGGARPTPPKIPTNRWPRR
jgi:hypothetical protein